MKYSELFIIIPFYKNMIECTWLSGILVTFVWYFVGLTQSHKITTRISDKYMYFNLAQTSLKNENIRNNKGGK